MKVLVKGLKNKESLTGDKTVCTGTVTNDGKITYKDIWVKGSFLSDGLEVIDSSFSKVANSIAPGETVNFEISVQYDYRISMCAVSAIEE